MTDLFRRSFLFAAGALVASAATVRVWSAAKPTPVVREQEVFFAILAEGSQWEVRVFGGSMAGTWHIDVPESCQDLPPPERVVVVDKVMARLRTEIRRSAAGPQIANPSLPRIA